MGKKLGVITVGQSPRDDVIPEITEFLGEGVEVIQSGALDGMTYEEILNLDTKEDDYILVSRMKDGTEVKFAERHVLPRIQKCIELLEAQGADVILLICTGVFPDVFKSVKPLLYPQQIIHSIVPKLLKNKELGLIIPKSDQITQCIKKWSESSSAKLNVTVASPYSQQDHLQEAIEQLKDTNAEIIVMDCIGYTRKMKKRVAESTGKSVVLARTLIARILGEILNSW